MHRMKTGLWIAVAVLVAALAGYLYGWWGASAYQAQRDRAVLRLHLSQATALALDGRVSLFTTNFGEASRQLEEALTQVAAARELLASAGRGEQATKLDQATALMKEAQTLAQKFNQDAGSRVARAVQLVREVYWETPAPE